MIATALDRLAAPPSAKRLGWRLIDARPPEGWIKVGFDGKRDFCNPARFIQGGILSAMLDDTMGPAVFVMSEGKLFTSTISLTVNFLNPAKPGPIIGEARVTPRQDHRLRRGQADGGRWRGAGGRHDQCAAGRNRPGGPQSQRGLSQRVARTRAR